MTLLEIRSVSKSFEGTPVLRDVSLHIDPGEIVCLLGPSGCGKTTLLRIISGLETADTGYISLRGHPLGNTPVHERGFGLMFQDYALFPHKNVAANVAFGLQMQNLPRGRVQERVAEMLDLVGLTGYDQRRVYNLSGGEQQRVALARSLAPGPQLLMLDEPLGSLDRALREELMNELRTILKRVALTAVYVTHDQQEAFAVADRLIVMHQGRIVQQGTPQTVYGHPNSPWVARFFGLNNLISGRVASLQPTQIDTPIGALTLPTSVPLSVGQQVTLLLRPETARPDRARSTIETDTTNSASFFTYSGTVQTSSFRGVHYRVVIRHETGTDLAFELDSDAPDLPQPGDPITLSLRTAAIDLWPEESHESED